MNTRVGSLLSKSKNIYKKKMRQQSRGKKKKKEKRKKMKKGNVDKPMGNYIWAFLSKNDV